MQVTSEKVIAVTLVLTEAEAKMLRDMLQNGYAGEDGVLSEFRGSLFNAIKLALSKGTK